MGVKIREILENKFFKNFKVLAGENGLDRETQAVSFFDAPDGYKWIKGKEFIVSSGYFIDGDLELFKSQIKFINEKNASAFGVKMDRYLDHIPSEIIDICNELSLPLIDIPSDLAWIDIINEVNSIAMNSYINRIKYNKNINKSINRSDNFDAKKERVLINLSEELNKVVTIYNTLENNFYTYPNNSKYKDILPFNDEGEYDFDYQKKTLCEQLNICRIESIENGETIKFITMPIMLKEKEVGNLIVWEDNCELDYYDLFPIRVSYILLLEVYEQIYLTNSFERLFYDDLIKSIVEGEIETKDSLLGNLNNVQDFNLSIDNDFLVISIKQVYNVSTFYNKREDISTMLLLNFPKDRAIFGILDDDIITIVLDVTEGKYRDKEIFDQMLENLLKEVQLMFSDSTIKIGIGDKVSDICNIGKSYNESIKAIDIGRYLYEDKSIIEFENLGPFGMFRLENVQSENFGTSFKNIEDILKEPNADELLMTLDAYLSNECNSNLAAKKLFIHSNTVRYRISKIQELCDIDLDDSIERVKMIITLKFMNSFQ